MMKLVSTTLALLSTSLAFAGGSMIGGGEVNFKSLMTCKASSIDPTFPNLKTVSVVKETYYNGEVIPGASFRVVTYSEDIKPDRFFVSHDTRLASLKGEIVNLELFGSSGNNRIGTFRWDSNFKMGSLMIKESDANSLELILSECALSL